jgi:hypothetical protein
MAARRRSNSAQERSIFWAHRPEMMDKMLSELLFEALDAWEEKQGLKSRNS